MYEKFNRNTLERISIVYEPREIPTVVYALDIYGRHIERDIDTRAQGAMRKAAVHLPEIQDLANRLHRGETNEVMAGFELETAAAAIQNLEAFHDANVHKRGRALRDAIEQYTDIETLQYHGGVAKQMLSYTSEEVKWYLENPIDPNEQI